MKDFWVLVLEQLVECGRMEQAYYAAEEIVMKEHGRRRFKTYRAFRVAKSRWYKTRKKTVIHVTFL
jgi:hypothetical protein